MPEPTSLRPDDLTIESARPVPAEFHFVDEDPSDPAAGHDVVYQRPDGSRVYA